MIILGIESTAHTYGVSIVDNRKKGIKQILSNEKDAYTTTKGGIIPMEAAKHHEEVKEMILERALKKAKLKLEDVKLIAFSQAPGLPPCLRVGKDEAKREQLWVERS